MLMNRPAHPGREDGFALERCVIRGFSGDGIRVHEVLAFWMTACSVNHNGGDGLHYHGADGLINHNCFSGNRGAGIWAQEGTGSTTLNSNRIEWNRAGGLLASRAWNWTITGNCLDRSGGPALRFLPGHDGLSCYNMTVTGNTILRSAASAGLDLLDEAHARLEGCRGLVFSSNSLCAGVNDRAFSKEQGKQSPDMGLVIRDLDGSVISGNTLWQGSLKELIHDLGGHGERLVLRENVGSLGFLA
jgi:hypothetical protein